MSSNLSFNPFKYFLVVYVFLYRLTGGILGGQVRGLPVLLLTTTGRKSGKQRTTPLGFIEQDGSYVVTGTNAGSDHHPAWYLNLKSQPRVELQIGNKHLAAMAEPAGPILRSQLWAKLVARAPAYGSYEKHTKREIPMVLLRPV